MHRRSCVCFLHINLIFPPMYTGGVAYKRVLPLLRVGDARSNPPGCGQARARIRHDRIFFLRKKMAGEKC